jgi:nucleoside-diphosphate-sugar epimerase
MKDILIIGAAGYIGSALNKHLKNKNYFVKTVDINWFGGPLVHYNVDYKTLDKEFLSTYSHIVLLAAHSSVLMCRDNFTSAWENNVTNFSNILSKLTKDQTLIYASSGSVYGQGGENRKEYMTLATAQCEYDLTKQIREKIAIGAECKTIGLRFGTLNGFNDYARQDLMLNAMVSSARNQKIINCTNVNNHRSILGINDCVSAIEKILKNSDKLDKHEIYNIASLSGKIGTFAKTTAEILDVPVVYNPEVTNNFSFELNCDKFCKDLNFEFIDDIESIVTNLKNKFDYINWSTRTEKKNYV